MLFRSKEATVVENKEKAPKADSTSASTLKSLSGVGPAMEKRMNALGVNSLADLTALTEDKIASMVAEDAKISAEQWNKWIQESSSL